MKSNCSLQFQQGHITDHLLSQINPTVIHIYSSYKIRLIQTFQLFLSSQSHLFPSVFELKTFIH